jgi:hypothetical protein
MAFDARTRCQLVTMLTRLTLSELTELEAFQGYIGSRCEIEAKVEVEGPGELYGMVKREIERRKKLSRDVLERIWLEPLRVVSYEPFDATYEGEHVLLRKTRPQPGDE